jgi:hypothetical protein
MSLLPISYPKPESMRESIQTLRSWLGLVWLFLLCFPNLPDNLLVRNGIPEHGSKKKPKIGGDLRQASEILSGTNIEMVGTVEVKRPPTPEILKQVKELAQ